MCRAYGSARRRQETGSARRWPPCTRPTRRQSAWTAACCCCSASALAAPVLRSPPMLTARHRLRARRGPRRRWALCGHMQPLMLRRPASAAAWTADTRRIHEYVCSPEEFPQRRTAVGPGEPVAGVNGIEQPVAGEPAQHAAGYLLLDHSNRFRRQCRGLSELDPAGLQRLEHPVQDAAVVVDVAIERSSETVDEARTPKRARAEASGQLLRRWASTTRRKMCSTAVTAPGSRSRYQRRRLGTDSTHWRTGRGGKT